jgi:hypothetical protein
MTDRHSESEIESEAVLIAVSIFSFAPEEGSLLYWI